MRTASVERNTKETQIKAELNLDGGEVCISTGIGFFDHMLTAFAVHGGFGQGQGCAESRNSRFEKQALQVNPTART